MERPIKRATKDLIDIDVGDVVRDEINEERNAVHDIKLQPGRLTLDNDEQIRALPKDAPTYELEKFEKKALLIFNHKYFEGDKRKTRLGTEHDAYALRNTFEKFGFDVFEHKDLKRNEVLNALAVFSETDFTDYGCIAVAVLTHGKEDKLTANDGAHYSELEILQCFNVSDKPTLVTKPRILIIQACRGKDPMDGVPVVLTPTIQTDSDEKDYYLPIESDVLIVHSSYRGKPSHRDTCAGSWFIQAFCKNVNELAEIYDLESIITIVKREVAVDKVFENFNNKTLRFERNKQMPVMTSSLIRKLYLKRYGDASPSFLPDLLNPSKSIADKSLQSHIGQSTSGLDHATYYFNCLRLTDWMSTTENSLQSEDRSAEHIQRLSLEVEEFRHVRDSINLIGPQLSKISTVENMMHIESIMARNNKRFDVITKRVKALEKEDIQKNKHDKEKEQEGQHAKEQEREHEGNHTREPEKGDHAKEQEGDHTKEQEEKGVHAKEQDRENTIDQNPQTTSNIDEVFTQNLQQLVDVILIRSRNLEVQQRNKMKNLVPWLPGICDWMSELMVAKKYQKLELQQEQLKSIMKNITIHQSGIDTLNEASAQILPSLRGTKKETTVANLATLNAKWGKLKQDANDRQKKVNEVLKISFTSEVEELLSWVAKVEGIIVTTDPIGIAGMENASSSKALHRFMELYTDVLARRPRVEAVLNKSEAYIKANMLPNRGSKVIHLRTRWESLTSHSPDKLLKLETAVRLAAEFQEIVQPFSDWLTKAQKTMASAKPPSVVTETLLAQIEDHRLFENEIHKNSGTLIDLHERTFYCQKTDKNEFVKLISTLQKQWDKFTKDVNARSRVLSNRLKEVNKFHNMWDNVYNWLSDTEELLDNVKTDSSSTEEIQQGTTKILGVSELPKALEVKKKEYDQTMRSGSSLLDKTPSDAPALQALISDLEIKWNLVSSKAADRTNRNLQTDKPFRVLVDYKRKVLTERSHGDPGTVKELIRKHVIYEKAMMRIVGIYFRDLRKKIQDPGFMKTTEDMKRYGNLMDLWEDIPRINESKMSQLENALKESEVVEQRVDQLLQSLSEAKSKLLSSDQGTNLWIKGRLIAKLEEMNDTVSAALSLLDKAHPDAEAAINQWITTIHSRWNELKHLMKYKHDETTPIILLADEAVSLAVQNEGMPKEMVVKISQNIKANPFAADIAEFPTDIDNIVTTAHEYAKVNADKAVSPAVQNEGVPKEMVVKISQNVKTTHEHAKKIADEDVSLAVQNEGVPKEMGVKISQNVKPVTTDIGVSSVRKDNIFKITHEHAKTLSELRDAVIKLNRKANPVNTDIAESLTDIDNIIKTAHEHAKVIADEAVSPAVQNEGMPKDMVVEISQNVKANPVAADIAEFPTDIDNIVKTTHEHAKIIAYEDVSPAVQNEGVPKEMGVKITKNVKPVTTDIAVSSVEKLSLSTVEKDNIVKITYAHAETLSELRDVVISQNVKANPAAADIAEFPTDIDNIVKTAHEHAKAIADEDVSPALQNENVPKEMVDKNSQKSEPVTTDINAASTIKYKLTWSEAAASAIGRDAMQNKTFTKWINNHLATINIQVGSLKDLSDGNNLISLLEVLSGERIRRERGQLRIHNEINVQTALWFICSTKWLVDIGAPDITGGDPKKIFAMIWIIIQRYQFSTKSVGSYTTRFLLKWVRFVTKEYPELNVTNFTSSWRDGLAFSALIHKHCPDMIDWTNIMSISVRKRLDTAFHAAEKCGVARLLDIEDVDTEDPDDKCLATYISLLYNKLSCPEP